MIAYWKTLAQTSTRFRWLTRPLPVLAFVAMTVAAFGFSRSRVAPPGSELTIAQARQALIELVKKQPENAQSWRLGELIAGGALAIVEREDQGPTWTFNCNLKARSFTFYADKPHGCSYHYTGRFERVAGKWQAHMESDYVACRR